MTRSFETARRGKSPGAGGGGGGRAGSRGGSPWRGRGGGDSAGRGGRGRGGSPWRGRGGGGDSPGFRGGRGRGGGTPGRGGRGRGESPGFGRGRGGGMNRGRGTPRGGGRGDRMSGGFAAKTTDSRKKEKFGDESDEDEAEQETQTRKDLTKEFSSKKKQPMKMFSGGHSDEDMESEGEEDDSDDNSDDTDTKIASAKKEQGKGKPESQKKPTELSAKKDVKKKVPFPDLDEDDDEEEEESDSDESIESPQAAKTVSAKKQQDTPKSDTQKKAEGSGKKAEPKKIPLADQPSSDDDDEEDEDEEESDSGDESPKLKQIPVPSKKPTDSKTGKKKLSLEDLEDEEGSDEDDEMESEEDEEESDDGMPTVQKLGGKAAKGSTTVGKSESLDFGDESSDEESDEEELESEEDEESDEDEEEEESVPKSAVKATPASGKGQQLKSALKTPADITSAGSGKKKSVSITPAVPATASTPTEKKPPSLKKQPTPHPVKKTPVITPMEGDEDSGEESSGEPEPSPAKEPKKQLKWDKESPEGEGDKGKTPDKGLKRKATDSASPESVKRVRVQPLTAPKEIVTEEEKRTAERDKCSLFVKNIPPKKALPSLKTLTPDVLHFRTPVQGSKYGWAVFATEKIAEKNYEILQNAKLGGQRLMVDFCGAKSKNKSNDRKQKAGETRINALELYLGNVPADASKNDILGIFPAASSVSLPHRRKGGQFCFVGFTSAQDARAAFESNSDVKLHGIPLDVRFSKIKQETKGSPQVMKPKQEAKSETGNKKQGIANGQTKKAQLAKKEESDDSDDDDDDDLSDLSSGEEAPVPSRGDKRGTVAKTQQKEESDDDEDDDEDEESD